MLVKGEKAKIIKDFDPAESWRTKELNKGKFDPNANKLIAKPDYNFENPAPIGKSIDVKPHGLNETENMMKEQGIEIHDLGRKRSICIFQLLIPIGYTPSTL